MNELSTLPTRWQKCWEIAPDFYSILKKSENVEIAREEILNHINGIEKNFRDDLYDYSNRQFIIFINSIRVLKNFFSKRYERIAKSSPINYIWQAALSGDSEVSDDFIDEFEHLFNALKGNASIHSSEIMDGIESTDFEKFKGRENALKRSLFLDILGKYVESYISRYPNGLQPEIQKKREENKKRILSIFGGTEKNWEEFQWQFDNAIKDEQGLSKLKKVIKISTLEENTIRLATENNVPFSITPFYLHLMDYEPSNNDYSLRRQVFPSLNYVKMMISHKNDRRITFDFMRENDTSPCDYITRRYPKVVVLKPVDTCPQICIYCQRNWEITSPCAINSTKSIKNLDNAIKWLSEHDQVMDLLISGGDPLILDNIFIDSLLGRLSKIKHLNSIRIATRTIVTAPQRIDDELLDILENYHQPGKRFIYIVTHFQHPYEICPETLDKTNKIKKRGLMIYNQQVFTFANSRRFETAALRTALKKIGIDPYYLFNMKGKSELIDYSVPVARILQERKEEARLLPGIYRTDESVFNVPLLGKNHIRAWQDHELISIRPGGERVYAFQPWEKNFRELDPYIYTDVTIRNYLEKLTERGENLEDYKSIWYYY